MCSLGRSVEGRQLLGLKITAGVRGERPLLRPQVKFSASLHGDEAVSRTGATYWQLTQGTITDFFLSQPVRRESF